jgi:hypothetical protein
MNIFPAVESTPDGKLVTGTPLRVAVAEKVLDPNVGATDTVQTYVEYPVLPPVIVKTVPNVQEDERAETM